VPVCAKTSRNAICYFSRDAEPSKPRTLPTDDMHSHYIDGLCRVRVANIRRSSRHPSDLGQRLVPGQAVHVAKAEFDTTICARCASGEVHSSPNPVTG
jgi:hypothetical protein